MSTAQAARDGEEGRRRRRLRSGDIIVVLLFLVLLLMLVQFNFTELFAILYHPVAGLVLLVVLVEFLWLKSGDRTRIYKLEIDKLRRLRREEEDLLRRSRELINQARLHPTEEDGRPGDWQRRASDLEKEIEEKL